MQFFNFTKKTVIQIEGKDSRRYLNARLTCNVKELQIGSYVDGAMLTPQGRTLGIFRVLCISINSFILVCDFGDSEDLVTSLKMFMVADRVDVKILPDSYLLHITCDEGFEQIEELFGAAFNDLKDYRFFSSEEIEGYLLKVNRGLGSGIDIICPTKTYAEIRKIFDNLMTSELTENDLLIARVKNKLPTFPFEISEEILFSESGRLDLVSFTKGCYAGQEVVERIDSLGKTAKIIRAAVSNSDISQLINQPIYTKNESSNSVGKILSAAYDSSLEKSYIFLQIKNIKELLENELLTENGISITLI